MITLNEIFYSLQGEGKWTGLPTIFIRTAGCNLQCTYCDTPKAQKNGKKIRIYDLLKRVEKIPCKTICITGGEPLLQKNLPVLIDKFLHNNYRICLETNGSIGFDYLPQNKLLTISMDIKCPSSLMHEQMKFENIPKLKNKDQLKMIIQNKKDYEYAKNIIYKYQPQCSVFFQPVWGSSTIKLAQWILKDGLNVQLGIQLHKLLWGTRKRV